MIHPVLFFIHAGGLSFKLPISRAIRPTVEMGHTVHHTRPTNKKSIIKPGHQTAQTIVFAMRPMSVSPDVKHKIMMAENIIRSVP